MDLVSAQLLPSFVFFSFTVLGWKSVREIFGKKSGQRLTIDELIKELPPETQENLFDEKLISKVQTSLKMLKLQRDIIGNALARIYEAEAKGVITSKERDVLLEPHKDELQQLDEKISRQQRIVDLYELEKARENLARSFHEKMAEIESKIAQLKSNQSMTLSDIEKDLAFTAETAKLEESLAKQDETASQESETDKTRSKAEERIEAIRDEVLRALERLEQIESEG